MAIDRLDRFVNILILVRFVKNKLIVSVRSKTTLLVYLVPKIGFVVIW